MGRIVKKVQLYKVFIRIELYKLWEDSKKWRCEHQNPELCLHHNNEKCSDT